MVTIRQSYLAVENAVRIVNDSWQAVILSAGFFTEFKKNQAL